MTDVKPHHAPSGGFRNPWPLPAPRGLWQLARWGLERRLRPPPPDPPPEVLPRAVPRMGCPLQDGRLAVTWLGHSTLLLESAGRRVLTDPVWGARVSPVSFAGPRRWVPPPVALEALPRLDLILVSHNHYDHLDRETVERLSRLQPEVPWLVPLGVGALVRRFGAVVVRECDWWDQEEVAGVRVHATPARHFSARGVLDRFRSLWCSWSVALGDRRIYFAGDTAYHPAFEEIGRRSGPFDLALLPIGAYEPRWFMQTVHMNPEEAVRAYRDLGAAHAGAGRRIMLGMHWGTYKLTDEPMDEPPRRARAAWHAAGLPPEDLWLLGQGETRVLGQE